MPMGEPLTGKCSAAYCAPELARVKFAAGAQGQVLAAERPVLSTPRCSLVILEGN